MLMLRILNESFRSIDFKTIDTKFNDTIELKIGLTCPLKLNCQESTSRYSPLVTFSRLTDSSMFQAQTNRLYHSNISIS